jgi:hypothetical protein
LTDGSPASFAHRNGLDRATDTDGLRSAVTGPHLPPLHTWVADQFDLTVSATAEYPDDLCTDELAGVSFEVAGLPSKIAPAGGIRPLVRDRS